jgi:uncharacterized protein with NRDE domain
MCTIVVLCGIHPDFPVVVAANRDEFYARATAGPEVVEAEPRIVAGRDLEHGGSWLGACATGMFVGLTNQRTFESPDPALRSRGEVVLEALRQGSLDGARRYVASLDCRKYNSFNLIYGDASAVEVAYARSDTACPEIEPLPGGVTVLTNDRLGSPDFPKALRAAELARAVTGSRWADWLEALGGLLADHQLPDEGSLADPPVHSVLNKPLLRQLQALCIHTPVYGTRSATVIAVVPGRIAHYAFADGPPCTARFVDVSHLLGASGPSYSC